MVVQRSQSGAYLLRDSTNDLLSHKVPASLLRLISYEGALSPDSFEVDDFVAHRGPHEDRAYLIRWKGFAPEFDSWVTKGTSRCLLALLNTGTSCARTEPHLTLVAAAVAAVTL